MATKRKKIVKLKIPKRKVHNMMAQRFGANARKIREKQDISRRTLAGILGSSEQYVYQLERGFRAPSLHMMQTMAVALGVTVEQLIKEA
jgi:transcriptional regulator with XRE-family HTH domain